MSEPKPTYTNGTYADAELTAATHHAELIEARAAIIKAGLALERALDIPQAQRAILSRSELRRLTNGET